MTSSERIPSPLEGCELADTIECECESENLIYSDIFWGNSLGVVDALICEEQPLAIGDLEELDSNDLAQYKQGKYHIFHRLTQYELSQLNIISRQTLIGTHIVLKKMKTNVAGYVIQIYTEREEYIQTVVCFMTSTDELLELPSLTEYFGKRLIVSKVPIIFDTFHEEGMIVA